MWKAPNLYLHDRVGQMLPGLSAYHVEQEGPKWVLVTEEINVGSGMASLLECFDKALNAPETNRIYLLKGVVTTWRNMTRQERREFADWHPGEGREDYDILGTDGEPLVRDFEIVSTVMVTDLICRMISFPEEWEDETDRCEGELTAEHRF